MYVRGFLIRPLSIVMNEHGKVLTEPSVSRSRKDNRQTVTVRSQLFNSHHFNSRVSNPRVSAYCSLNTPLENSNSSSGVEG